MINIKNRKIYLIIIILLLLDQISKIVFLKIGATGDTKSIENNLAYRVLISIVVIILILRYINSNNSYIKNDTRIILSIGVSGIIGNLIDLIWNKEVITFINVFSDIKINLAYIFIIIAWVGMAVILTKNTMNILKEKGNKKDGNKTNKN